MWECGFCPVSRLNLCYLIVLDGLCQRFHLNRLIQLVFMQQVNEIIQGALMEAHLWVECPHTLQNLHSARAQSPEGSTKTNMDFPDYILELHQSNCRCMCGVLTVRICAGWPARGWGSRPVQRKSCSVPLEALWALGPAPSSHSGQTSPGPAYWSAQPRLQRTHALAPHTDHAQLVTAQRLLPYRWA